MPTVSSTNNGQAPPLARMLALITAHGVIDFFSYIIIPILTVLEGRVGLSPAQGAMLLALGSVASGLVQPLTAWAGDRYDTRWFGTVGLLCAVLAMGMVGFADSFWQLLLIQGVGSAGVGAFHPPGAAAMGQLAGRRRSLGVSVFFAAGMVGGISANWLTPHYVRTFSPESLAWLMIPGVLTAGLLIWSVHAIPHRAAGAREAHDALPLTERRARWSAVGLLYVANVARFVVNMMLVQLIIRWSEMIALGRMPDETLTAEVRTLASTIGGPVQAAMQVGMGVAGLLLGAIVRERHERLVLVIIPALSAIAVAAFPMAQGKVAAFALAVVAGVGFAGVMPITISMAQRLLPHRTGLASGLMMGGAWGLAFVGPPTAQWLLERIGLGGAFLCTAGLLAGSGVLMMWMRRVL